MSISKFQENFSFWMPGLIASIPLLFLCFVVFSTWSINNDLECKSSKAAINSTFSGNTDSCVTHIPRIEVSDVKDTSYEWSFLEFKGRYYWGLSAVLFSITSLISFVITLYIVFSVTNIATTICFSLSMTLMFFLFTKVEQTWAINTYLLNTSIYEYTSALDTIVLIEASGHTLLLGTGFAISAIIYRSFKYFDIKDPNKITSELGACSRSMSTLLFSITPCLIAAAIHSAALYSWSINYYETTDYFGNQLGKFPTVMGFLSGAIYSLFLSAMFVSGFGLLRWRIRQLALEVNNGNDSNAESWISKQRLLLSTQSRLASFFAVMGPLLIGGPGLEIFKALVSVEG